MREEHKPNGYQMFKGEDAVKRFIDFVTNAYNYIEGETIEVVVEIKCARPSCNNTYEKIFVASDLKDLKIALQKGPLNLEEVCSTCFIGSKK